MFATFGRPRLAPLKTNRSHLVKYVLSAALLFAGLLTSAPSSAQNDDRLTVFIHNFQVSKKLETDGSVFASSICTQLLRDQTLDVLCEDDMTASLAHSSQLQLFGNDDASGKRIGAADRMNQIKVLVHGKISKGKHGLILDVTVWERDPSFEDEILKTGRKHGHIRIKGIAGGVSGVFSRLERITPRIAALTKKKPLNKAPR